MSGLSAYMGWAQSETEARNREEAKAEAEPRPAGGQSPPPPHTQPGAVDSETLDIVSQSVCAKNQRGSQADAHDRLENHQEAQDVGRSLSGIFHQNNTEAGRLAFAPFTQNVQPQPCDAPQNWERVPESSIFKQTTESYFVSNLNEQQDKQDQFQTTDPQFTELAESVMIVPARTLDAETANEESKLEDLNGRRESEAIADGTSETPDAKQSANEKSLKMGSCNYAPQRNLKIQSNEHNERFMRRVVGNLGKIQGVNLDKVRQSSFIKNSANFSSTEFKKGQLQRDHRRFSQQRDRSSVFLQQSAKLVGNSQYSNFEDRYSNMRRQHSQDLTRSLLPHISRTITNP